MTVKKTAPRSKSAPKSKAAPKAEASAPREDRQHQILVREMVDIMIAQDVA